MKSIILTILKSSLKDSIDRIKDKRKNTEIKSDELESFK